MTRAPRALAAALALAALPAGAQDLARPAAPEGAVLASTAAPAGLPAPLTPAPPPAAPPPAAPPPGPRCPHGETPRFSGHPFRPLECRAEGPAPEPTLSVEPAEASRPRVKDRARRSLKGLVGRWTGLAYYGTDRYDVAVAVAKARGRAYRVEFLAREHATHFRSRLNATLKDSFWSPGRYAVETAWEPLPRASVKGRAWLGGTSPASELERQGFDRELLLLHDGRADEHRLRFVLDAPARIRYSYTYRDGSGKTMRVLGELRPAAP